MNKIDQLIVRACKSKDPEKRLDSVVRRFYLQQPNDSDKKYQLLNILVQIVNDYKLCSITQALFAYQEASYIQYLTPSEKLIDFCLGHIRHAERSKFPHTMRVSRRFK